MVVELGPSLAPKKNAWMTSESGYHDKWDGVKAVQATQVKSTGGVETSFTALLCQRVSIIGLNKVGDPEYGYFRKFLWLILIFSGFGLGIFQSHTQIKKFFNRPVNINLNITAHSALTFPTLTICNFNYFQKKKTDAAQATELAWLILREIEGTDLTPYEREFAEFNWTTVFTDFSQSKSDALSECVWKQKKCSVDDFRQLTTDMGWCFQFNSEKPLRQITNAGTEYGLRMNLIVQTDQYLAGRHGPGVGFKILAHENCEVPIMKTHGVAIAPGMVTFIGIQKKTATKLPYPHGSCGEKQLKYFSKYTASGCHQECRTDYLVQKCGCKDAEMPGNHTFCTPKDMYDCGFDALRAFVTDTNVTCLQECPEQCVDIVYDTQVSSVPISEPYFQEKDDGDGTLIDYLRNNLAVVYVYFTDMNVQEIEQQGAYSSFDMFCDVGGSFGLVLGASVLTFLDIMDFLIYYFLTRKGETKVTAS